MKLGHVSGSDVDHHMQWFRDAGDRLELMWTVPLSVVIGVRRARPVSSAQLVSGGAARRLLWKDEAKWRYRRTAPLDSSPSRWS